MTEEQLQQLKEDLADWFQTFKDYPIEFSEDGTPKEITKEDFKRVFDDLRKCAEEGHDLRDEGYAGPESGCISLVCNRCGYSYHHTLY